MNGVLIYLKPAKSPLKKESNGTPFILLSLSFFWGYQAVRWFNFKVLPPSPFRLNLTDFQINGSILKGIRTGQITLKTKP